MVYFVALSQTTAEKMRQKCARKDVSKSEIWIQFVLISDQ